MDNQHARITGYRDLSQAEIDAGNRLKALGAQLDAALAEARAAGADGRALAIAQTQLQTGLMWAVRAVFKPTGF